MKRGYLFALDALLGLLLLMLVLSQLRGAAANMDKSAFGEVAQYQALQDLVEIGVRNWGGKLEGLSHGDAGSRDFLAAKYGALAPRLGNFCLKISAGECENCGLAVNCARQGYRTVLGANRLLASQSGFFEVHATLSR